MTVDEVLLAALGPLMWALFFTWRWGAKWKVRCRVSDLALDQALRRCEVFQKQRDEAEELLSPSDAVFLRERRWEEWKTRFGTRSNDRSQKTPGNS